MRLLFVNPFRNFARALERTIGNLDAQLHRQLHSQVSMSSWDLTDAERDSRDGDQWLLSTIAYLEYRYGKAWRKIHRLGERDNPKRWQYLTPARLLHSLRYFNAPPCDCSRCLPVKKGVASEHDVPTWSGEQIRAMRKTVGA